MPAGKPKLHRQLQEMRNELLELRREQEWQRQLGVITALLPYSGENASRNRRRRAFPPLPSSAIPKQRQPLPSEQRLVDAARRARYPHLRSVHGRSEIPYSGT